VVPARGKKRRGRAREETHSAGQPRSGPTAGKTMASAAAAQPVPSPAVAGGLDAGGALEVPPAQPESIFTVMSNQVRDSQLYTA
jgi:hypothetical protein